MKDSKDKEHRISNLKDMINNVNEDEDTSYDDIEEDKELIRYLNEDREGYGDLEIDDEFIYHPDEDTKNAVNLEENPIDDEFLIKTPKEMIITSDGVHDILSLKMLKLILNAYKSL